jgi:ribosomal protein L31
MKSFIRSLLFEAVQDQMMVDAKKKLENFESKYSDILEQYKELKLMVDKLEHLKNIPYKVNLLKQKNGREYYSTKVKYPFVDLGEKTYPFFNIHLGEKKFIDKMSEFEKDKFIRHRIDSYLMKKFPL